MKAMFVASVLPRVRAVVGDARPAFAFAQMQVLGPSEAALGERIASFMVDGRNPAVGITASNGMLTIRVAARCDVQSQADALCAGDVASLRLLAGSDLVSEGEAPLQQVLVDLLRQRAATIAVAESCTAGMLASALGDVAGVSAVLLGGVVAYSNAVKERDLDVPAARLSSLSSGRP